MIVQSARGSFCLLLLISCSELQESAPVSAMPPAGVAGAPSPILSPEIPERRARTDRGDFADGAMGGQGGSGPELCSGERREDLTEPPILLSETGLYSSIEAKEVSAEVHWFTPRYWLWSDGAEKERYIFLPSCGGVINNADEDNWSFPVGTRLWKQFSVEGKRIETRLIVRHGLGVDDFLYAHYLWNDAETDAYLIEEHAPFELLHQPKGTNYTVPTRATCSQCHGKTGAPEGGLPSRVLGFSAVQLSHTGPGVTLKSLVGNGRLSHPRSGFYETPGTEIERAATGYLHANCGFCHNYFRDGVAFPFHPLSFFMSTQALRVGELDVYQTAVGHDVQGYDGDCSLRVAPGDLGVGEGSSLPLESCVLERMGQRGNPAQMPPIDSYQVDLEGIEAIRRWIQGL